ncbi:acetate--CoA ligase family protein [Ornithinimicrobium pratense]|uniref:Acetyl-CoA synthetase n=1 Tax=Ornithinimicrobium pratense TaxID=2593973 RepID=A0A5J6V8R5_9MICO|nr:acetate--CoA ligase family protein [Ornithinimicrobium pratense]QFG69907.1 acetyl-CoA synthetase [Ornithinimicrobium pratense]
MTSEQASASPLPARPDARPAALRPLWVARGIAVVGASDRAGAVGRLPVQFLQRYGYTGGIYPVRPDGAPVAGLTSYPSVEEAARAGEVDVAMVMVAADKVVAAVQDCAAAGVGVVIVCSSGFAETGPAGAALQDELVRVAGELGVRVLGPNCIGTVGTATGQVSSFSPLFSGASTQLVPGGIGFVSQSGALGYGAVSLAFERGLGLGWVVNTGNEADIGATEVMAALAEEQQPRCTGLLGYAESLGDLSSLARVTASGVPVAMLKAGRSDAGARAAASHTGALATGDKVVDAALRRAGVVRVDDVEELLDVGDVMVLVPLVQDRQVGSDGVPGRAPGAPLRQPGGARLRRIAVVTTSGGSGILAADAIEARGLELAALADDTLADLDQIVPAYGSTANPVDVTASVMSNPDLFDQALTTIAQDPGVDAIVACFCVLTGSDVDAVVQALARVRERTGVPVVVTRTGADHLAPDAAATMRAAGLPVYPTPARAVRAVAALAQFVQAGSRAGGNDRDQPAGHAPPDLWAHTDESSLKQALAGAGLPVPVGRLVSDRDDALAAVEQAGGQAVFKAVVPGLLHKSEAGGVVLDVTSERAAEVYDRLGALRGPDGSAGQVLVEEMVPPGVEVLVGSADTPLGRILTVGVGGVLTEVVADVALRLLPIDRQDVEEMVDETRLRLLLAGARGRPPADRAALVDTIAALADLAATLPAGAELDLNPITVLAEGDGVRILDAALALADEED